MTALLHFPYLLWGVLFAVLDVQEVQFQAEHFVLLLLLDGNMVTLVSQKALRTRDREVTERGEGEQMFPIFSMVTLNRALKTTLP